MLASNRCLKVNSNQASLLLPWCYRSPGTSHSLLQAGSVGRSSHESCSRRCKCAKHREKWSVGDHRRVLTALLQQMCTRASSCDIDGGL